MRPALGALPGAESRTLQRTFALGDPVLVIGPGCQRIGFDRTGTGGAGGHGPTAWDEVLRRTRLVYAAADASGRDFLEPLWRSKLSDETLAALQGADLPPDLELVVDDGAQPIHPRDRMRTEFGGLLLRVLIDCTRALGSVLTTGQTPVVSWHTLIQVTPAEDDWGDGATWRRSASDALDDVAGLASALWSWSLANPLSSANERYLESVGIEVQAGSDRDERLRAELSPTLDRLDVEAIADCTGRLVDSCLRGGDLPLSGATIEWLADLLWHILAGDSMVPPSQAEYAFYVNLRKTTSRRARLFTRPHPGEYRGEASDRSTLDREHGLLSEKIVRRLLAYDSGLERATSWDWSGDERLRFTRTIAATLLAHTDSERSNAPPAIALSASYDLSLERQVYEILEPGQRFHVIVPVWVRALGRNRHLDWLWGSYVKREGTFAPEHLQSPAGKRLSWSWYSDEEERETDIEGPILIKGNGSPLMHLAGRRSGPVGLGEAGLRSREHWEEETVELATIFSEYDSLASIITLSAAGETRQGLPGKVHAALAWDRRSWLFFGDSFPDWIPRLRLLYGARSSLGVASSVRSGARLGDLRPAVTEKIALDRDFDWPEVALLGALEVSAYECDLAYVANYPRQSSSDPEVGAFLSDVQDRWGRGIRPVEG